MQASLRRDKFLSALPRPTAGPPASEELLEPVRHLLARQQEIERVVSASQKAVDAHTAEDGKFYGGPPEC